MCEIRTKDIHIDWPFSGEKRIDISLDQSFQLQYLIDCLIVRWIDHSTHNLIIYLRD